MLSENNREYYRQHFFNAWHKHVKGHILEPWESIVVDIIQKHPEYHHVLDDPGQFMNATFPEDNLNSNPFLHIGMHLALQEHIQLDRPAGFQKQYFTLLSKYKDPDWLEHKVMNIILNIIHESVHQQRKPDESKLLAALEKLGNK